MVLAGVLLIVSCSSQPDNTDDSLQWQKTVKTNLDTTVKVYGHYAAVKLPISSGVTLWNPTQVAIGPGGLMYVANYTGEIFSLHDTDGDGLEDHAKLYCDVKKTA